MGIGSPLSGTPGTMIAMMDPGVIAATGPRRTTMTVSGAVVVMAPGTLKKGSQKVAEMTGHPIESTRAGKPSRHMARAREDQSSAITAIKRVTWSGSARSQGAPGKTGIIEALVAAGDLNLLGNTSAIEGANAA